MDSSKCRRPTGQDFFFFFKVLIEVDYNVWQAHVDVPYILIMLFLAVTKYWAFSCADLV